MLIRKDRSILSHPLWDSEDWMWPFEMTSQGGLSVSEDAKQVTVEAHMPGLKSNEIEITFEKGILWVHGQKKEEKEDKKKKYYRKAMREYSYRLQVPGMLDEKKEPDAMYKDGVLKVSFMKKAAGQPKKIAVKAKS